MIEVSMKDRVMDDEIFELVSEFAARVKYLENNVRAMGYQCSSIALYSYAQKVIRDKQEGLSLAWMDKLPQYDYFEVQRIVSHILDKDLSYVTLNFPSVSYQSFYYRKMHPYVKEVVENNGGSLYIGDGMAKVFEKALATYKPEKKRQAEEVFNQEVRLGRLVSTFNTRATIILNTIRNRMDINYGQLQTDHQQQEEVVTAKMEDLMERIMAGSGLLISLNDN